MRATTLLTGVVDTVDELPGALRQACGMHVNLIVGKRVSEKNVGEQPPENISSISV